MCWGFRGICLVCVCERSKLHSGQIGEVKVSVQSSLQHLELKNCYSQNSLLSYSDGLQRYQPSAYTHSLTNLFPGNDRLRKKEKLTGEKRQPHA